MKPTAVNTRGWCFRVCRGEGVREKWEGEGVGVRWDVPGLFCVWRFQGAGPVGCSWMVLRLAGGPTHES